MDSFTKFTTVGNLIDERVSHLADFSDNALRGVGAIETIAVKDLKYLNYKSHIARVSEALKYFGLQQLKEGINEILAEGLRQFASIGDQGLVRVYIPYHPDKIAPLYRFTKCPIPLKMERFPLAFHPFPYAPGYAFKTMSRLVYHTPEVENTIIFVNDSGFACESKYHSILLSKGGYLFTPAVPALASPSTALTGLREQGFNIYEAYIKADGINDYDWAILINSGSYQVLHNHNAFEIDGFISSLSIFRH